MIKVYGQGRPGDLGKPIFHHARGVLEVATAVLAGLWTHELQTDLTRTHEMHFGKGANGVNLYLDNGEKFAFRGHADASGAYDYVQVHRGSVRPLGPVVLELHRPDDSARLWQLLSEAANQDRVAAA